MASEVDGVDEKQVEEVAKELEYVYGELFTKDDQGNFVPNEEAIKESPYDKEEIEKFKLFAQVINGEVKLRTKKRAFEMVKSCLQDALNIGQAAMKQIAKEIDKGNWIGAAGLIVSAAAGAVSLPVVISFILLCRGPVVE